MIAHLNTLTRIIFLRSNLLQPTAPRVLDLEIGLQVALLVKPDNILFEVHLLARTRNSAGVNRECRPSLA
jgi:hypothetical protein